VTVVAGERAIAPISVIKLVTGSPVVEKQSEAPAHNAQQGSQPGGLPHPDLRRIVLRKGMTKGGLKFSHGGLQRRRREPLDPLQPTAGDLNTDLPWHAAPYAEPLDRQRIQHLVGNEYAGQRGIGQVIQPGYPVQLVRHPCFQRLTLPLSQLRTDFEHQVPVGRTVAHRQQQLGSERAGASTSFDDRTTSKLFQPAAHKAGETPRERGSEFRRRDEITRRAKFLRTRTVVAETRRVENGIHIVCETQEPVTGNNALGHQRPHPFAVRKRHRIGRRYVRYAMHGGVILTAGLNAPGAHWRKAPAMIEALPLAGKWALITGAGRRVGAAIARTLHRQGAGVAIHYRGSASEAESLARELNDTRPGSALTVQANLLETGRLPALVGTIVDHAGRLDILVNNASSFYPTPLDDISEEQWEDLLGTNLKAPLFLARAALPHLKAARGVIINIVDIHAIRPLRNHTIYGAAKAGLGFLTRALARDLAPDIRVNGVAPGAILWPDGGVTEQTRDSILKQIPMRRVGEPDDIATCVLYLVRDANYVTGQIVAVDGGRSIGW